MKKVFLSGLMVLALIYGFAQSWNPYVNQGIVSPAPLLPFEFNGTGTLSFNVGNTGSSELPVTNGDAIRLTIELSNGLPDDINPLAAMGGNWLSKFTWTYNSVTNIYTGVQNQILPGAASGTISIRYKVSTNTSLNAPKNGFKVTLTPPLYCNGFNATDDDLVSSYTFTSARDYGDAPLSYGQAFHVIDLIKDGNEYLRNVYFGNSVDFEPSYQASSNGNGDDLNGSVPDDEDGVTIPALYTGTNATIPVVVTVRDISFGYLYVWFDWNADGDFLDAGELVKQPSGSSEIIDASVTINLSINVPANANAGNTFARFRIGDYYTNPSAVTGMDFGEVEDYQINIIGLAPLITLEKTGTYIDNAPIGIYNEGDQISYTFKVTNSGNITLTNIVVTDPKVTVSGTSIASLASGASNSTNYTALYTLTQADINAGTFKNVATVTGTPPSGPNVTGTDDDIKTITRSPGIAVIKTGSVGGTGKAGDVITYTLSIKNTGNVTLSSVQIDDARTGTTGKAVSPATLEPGATGTAIVTYIIKQADVDAGKVENQAIAKGNPPTGPGVTDLSDNNSYTENDPTVIPLTQSPAIAVIKTASVGGSGQSGDIITYTFTVKNIGNTTLTNVRIDDLLTASSNLAISPSTLLPDAVGTVTANYTIKQTDINTGSVQNQATAKGNPPSGQSVTDLSDNNSYTENDPTVVPLTQSPAIAVIKTAIVGGTGQVGDVITYTFMVKNTGNTTLTNVRIDDALTASTNLAVSPSTLNVGGIGTVTANYIIKQTDVNAGKVENQATAKGTPPTGSNVTDFSDNNSYTENDPTVVPLTQLPKVRLVKTGVLAGSGTVGDVITYTFTVTNTGNILLTNLKISDTKLSLTNLAVSPSSLAPGASGTATATYSVLQADVNNGEVKNSAIVTGTPPTGPNVTDVSDDGNELVDTPADPDTDPTNDPTVVPITPSPKVKLVKTGIYSDLTPTGTNPGDVINYTFTVTNMGNVTLTNLFISDVKLSLTNLTVIPSTLASGESGTATAAYTITQPDINVLKVVNSALVTGTSPTGGTVTDVSDSGDELLDTNADEDSDPTNDPTVVPLPPITCVNPQLTVGEPKCNADDGTYSVKYYSSGTVSSNAGIVGQNRIYSIPLGTDVTITALENNDCMTRLIVKTPGSCYTNCVTPNLSVGQGVCQGQGTWSADFTETTGAVITYNTGVRNGNIISGVAIGTDLIITATNGNCVASITVKSPKNCEYFCNSPYISISGPICSGGSNSTYYVNIDPIPGVQLTVNAGTINTAKTQISGIPTGTNLLITATLQGCSTLTYQVPSVACPELPGIDIQKDASPSKYLNAGDIITYNIKVTNTGNVTLYNVNTTDPLTGLNQVISILEPGANKLYTQTYSIKASDITAKKVINTATATASTGKGTISDTDDATVIYDEFPIVINCPKSIVENSNFDCSKLVGNLGVTTYVSEGIIVKLTWKMTGATVDESPATGINPLHFHDFNIGVTTVTYTVTDSRGLSASCSFTVTIIDNNKPIIRCYPDLVLKTNIENCQAKTILPLPDVQNICLNDEDFIFSNNAPQVFPIGLTTFLWTVENKSGNRSTCVQKVIVPPCANDDYYSELQGTTVNGNVSLNDTYIDGCTFTNTSTPPNGTMIFNPNGTFTFTPNAGFTGDVTFTYKVCLSEPYNYVCDDAVVKITIKPKPPIANDDIKTGDIKGENVTLNILTNDILSNGNGATPTSVTIDIDASTPGNQSTLTVTGEGMWTYNPATGNITFDPDNNFKGNPTPITYVLTDNVTSLSDPAIVTITYGQNPVYNAAIGLVKTSVYDSKSGKVFYTYTVTNTGDVTVYDVIITETPASFTGKGVIPVPQYVSGGADLGENTTLKDLAVGASMIWKSEYTVTQADLDAGFVTNQALASGKDPDGKPVTDKSDESSPVKGNDDPTITPLLQPEIGIVKTSVYDKSNGTIAYTYTITNIGKVTLFDIAVNETLSSFTGKGTIPIPKYVSGGSELGGDVSVKDLEVGATMTWKATYKVTQADMDAGSVTNQALASGKDGKGEPYTDKSDDNSPLKGNDDPTITILPQNPEIGLVKTSFYDKVKGIITYTYTATNTGDLSLYDIKIKETVTMFTGTGTLPVPEYDSGGSDLGGTTGLKDLAPGGTITFKSTYIVTQADILAGSVTNQALAESKDPKGNLVTDKSDETSPLKGNDDPTVTEIGNLPEIGIVKTSVFDKVSGIVTYTYTVTNTGKTILLDINVSESISNFSGKGALPIPVYVSGGSDLGGNAPLKDLNPGASMIWNAQYKVTQADLDSGSITNQALSTGKDPKGKEAADKSDYSSPLPGNDKPTVTKLDQKPEIGIVKTSLYDEAKGIVSYTYTVINTGNLTLYDIIVNETALIFTGKGELPVPAYSSGGAEIGSNPNLKDLIPGDKIIFKSEYKVTQEDINSGSVTNQALASGKDPKGVTITDKSDKTSPLPGNDDPTITNLKPNPSIQVIKTQDKATYSKSGDVINYTIVVKNTGNVVLINIKVDDPLTGLTQEITKLDPGKETVLTTKYTVKQSDVDAGSITNKVKAIGKDSQGKDISGESTVTATANSKPEIKIEKASDLIGTSAELGQVITYTLRITNTGNITLINVEVNDTLTGFTSNVGTMLPGDIKTFTTTYRVKPLDEASGKVVNSATVIASFAGAGKLTNTAKVTDLVKFCELDFPEIFTPNGDNIQDLFVIGCIEKYPDARIIVFNRWGNKVYTKEHYGNYSKWGNTDAWWDGYSDHKWTLGNERLPAGTYYYILYLNDNIGTRKQGFVYLNSDNIK